jgi:hypothetical protein
MSFIRYRKKILLKRVNEDLCPSACFDFIFNSNAFCGLGLSRTVLWGCGCPGVGGIGIIASGKNRTVPEFSQGRRKSGTVPILRSNARTCVGRGPAARLYLNERSELA